MGRDGVLSKKIFGYIEKKRQTPIFNLMFIGIIGVIGIFMNVSTSTSFINFGAFISFAFVNLSVIVFYFVKLKQRQGMKRITYFTIPLIGMILDICLFISLDKHALILGTVWTSIGFIYLICLTRGFSKLPPTLAI